MDAYRDLLDAWCYFLAPALVVLWEMLAPCRDLSRSLRMRWFSNLSLFISSVAVIRWFTPVLCAGLAALMAELGWGLFNIIDVPQWCVFLFTILMMDLTRYGMHVLYHRVPLFWRLHRLHHTDQDFDITTSVRFHPFELGLGIGSNFLLIMAFGLPPEAVILTEALAFMVNSFNHGNVRMPKMLDRLLRLVIVTPDMHRVHHSTREGEFNANLGGFLSCWDRIFATYLAEPHGGHREMEIGLPGFFDPRHLTLGWMLAIPFLPLETVAEDRPTDPSSPDA